MVKFLLDTDILSEYLKGHNEVVADHANRYAREHGVFTYTSVSVHEIIFGLKIKAALLQLKRTVAWLSRNEEITPNGEDYILSAAIKATARQQGSVLEMSDCLIAAVAVRLDMPLVTGNIKDFQAIQKTGVGLILHNWRLA